jgi:NAD(P)-dependent dehydrogenase (short-subunit alcohol dehydrogenase family)
MPVSAARYFFCVGLLRSKPLADQTEDELAESMVANYSQVVFECDRLLSANACARICVMGSESGYSGSFDGSYALAKERLHRYVETKRLPYPGQQLVCVAPSIILDASMTLRRADTDGLERRRWAHPKRRYLAAMEVAQMVHHLLYVDRGYTTGTVVRMHGGAAAWA